MHVPKIRRDIKARLAQRGITQIEVAREAGIAYDRLTRLLNGYRPPRGGELEAILSTIEKLASRART